MNEPMWISFLRSNPEAVNDFLLFLRQAIDVDLLHDLRDAVLKDDANESKLILGEIRALDKLRKLSTIQIKENEGLAEYQQIRGLVRGLKKA